VVSRKKITDLLPNEIFVFGSNLLGLHGAGAARQALKFGAKWGQSAGLQGRCWAIPTKDERLNTLPLTEIEKYVNQFLNFAKQNLHYSFQVTEIGCGLAGYHPNQIAPFFRAVIDEQINNVHLPRNFLKLLL